MTSSSNPLFPYTLESLLDREPIDLGRAHQAQELGGKTVLVTGGAGSIGSEMVRQLAACKPHSLLIIDQAETPLYELQLDLEGEFPQVDINYFVCDITRKSSIEHIIARQPIDFIFHAAAYKHVPLMETNPAQAVWTNLEGTKIMADLAVAYAIPGFVMISSDKAVNPTGVMGATKRAAELYVQALNHRQQIANAHRRTRFITTRFGNVLGSNGSVVHVFKKQINNGGPITITDKRIIRYFMSIPEACQLVLEAALMGKGGEIYIFDMGDPVRILDLAKKMIRISNPENKKTITIEEVGLRPGEKLYEELLTDTCTTVPTHHEKILISQDNSVDFGTVGALVEDIIQATNSFKKEKILQSLKSLIPSFQPDR